VELRTDKLLQLDLSAHLSKGRLAAQPVSSPVWILLPADRLSDIHRDRSARHKHGVGGLREPDERADLDNGDGRTLRKPEHTAYNYRGLLRADQLLLKSSNVGIAD
jgi:hypothetical protein